MKKGKGENQENTTIGGQMQPGVMRHVANIAHHGALIGFEDIEVAMCEIRKLTLPWWDKEECEKLQRQKKTGA